MRSDDFIYKQAFSAIYSKVKNSKLAGDYSAKTIEDFKKRGGKIADIIEANVKLAIKANGGKSK